MLKSKRKPENLLEDVDYSFPNISRTKLIGVLFGLFFFAFTLNFPLFQIIDDNLKNALSKIPGCPIVAKEINFGILLPRIELTAVQIPARCAGKDLFLDKLKIYFRGPSFAPFGIATKLETTIEDLPLEIYASLGTSKQLLKFDEMNLDLSKISKKIPEIKLEGNIKIDGLVELQNQKISKINALIESKDFILPSQLIQGFTTPQMNVKSLAIQIAQETDNKMELKKLIIGDLDSPVRANFSGIIVPNKNNFLFSRLDLQGEIAFSTAIEQDFGLLLNFFNAFPKKDKFYQMRVHGTIGQPVPKPL